MKLFEHAKKIGIEHITDILPNGRRDGDEWIALNPTRDDHNLGSFRINLITGSWGDFADTTREARGNDIVSLYAYLNRSIFDSRASQAGYKNHDGGIQAEAAKDLLISYDPDYFPDPKDDFTPKKTESNDYWSGYRQLVKGMAKPPELKTDWYQDKWGDESGRWEFIVDNKTVMRVVRFKKTGKKNDRPFTLWTDGKNKKWRSKALETKYPLWNQDSLEKSINKPVLLTEGQKDAALLSDVMEKYVCVGWYGGASAVEKTEWEPLTGREVYFSFDADGPGRKAVGAIRKIAEEKSIKLHLVFPPEGAPKGWSIADVLTDGTADDIEKIIKEEKEEQDYLDDSHMKFKILGYSGEYITFYSYGSKTITRYKASTLTKGVLVTLMDIKEWAKYFVKDDGGIAWDAAINYIIRQAESKPVFDSKTVRGTGAWIDGGKLVVNTGEKLIVDGQERDLHDLPGKYVYEKCKKIPYRLEDPLSSAQSTELLDVLSMIAWKEQVQAYLLTGWILLAPFGGALRWRPHIWVTGRRGSGKSWIIEAIVNPIVGERFGVKGTGSSTPAGIRSSLRNSSLCTVMDEMESDNFKYAELIDQNLKMFREASSGTGGMATLHGSSDGEGRQWIVQSMALFASIGAGLKHGADKSRFTQLEIDGENQNIKERQKRFEQIEKMATVFTEEWSEAFHARTYNIFNEVIKCIKIMRNQAINITKNPRDADQIGTLLAGSWMVQHDQACTAAEARDYLEALEIGNLFRSREEKADEELCLDEIFTSIITLEIGDKPSKKSIGNWLDIWYQNEKEVPSYNAGYIDTKKLSTELEQYGIKPIKRSEALFVQIAIGHSQLKKILKESAWHDTYDSMIERLPFCDGETHGPGRFAGVRKRYKELDLQEVLDAVPF